jgi:hypothetical protein
MSGLACMVLEKGIEMRLMKYVLLVLLSSMIFLGVGAKRAAPSVEMASLLEAPSLQPTLQPHGLDEVQLLASQPRQAHDDFGRAVAIDGDVLAVGAPGVNHPEHGEDCGAVYLFQRLADGWQEVAMLSASDPQPVSGFGMAVAVAGERIAVGARFANTEQGGNAAGAVYLFERVGDGWQEQAKITARDGGVFHLFGYAVDLHDDTLVIGARGAPGQNPGDNAGVAYVYHLQGDAWVEQARLASPEARPNDFFGHAVAVWGDWIAVGAYGYDSPQIGANSGEVYLFLRRDGLWFEAGRLAAADARPFAQFGTSLAFSGSDSRPAWLLIGANQDGADEDTHLGYGALIGTAYAFQYKNGAWDQAFKWKLDEPPEYGIFGEVVAIGQDGRGDLVGAVGSFMSGGVHIFPLRSPDKGTKSIQGPTNWAGPVFGQTIAFSGPTLVVGAQWDEAGSVFVYELKEGIP